MIRSKSILPDRVETLDDGTQMEVVSVEAMVEAFVGFAQFMDMAGGWLTVGLRRAPTGVPNEMRTVAAIIEWRDRTDAKVNAEDPAASSIAHLQETEVPAEARLSRDPTPEEMEKALEDDSLQGEVVDADNPDGFVPQADEDLDSIPASLR